MAEVHGTIASAIAVAEVGFKVGGTVFKLRQLWKEVQEVPETIRDMMREIYLLEPLLSEVERDFEVENTIHLDTGPLQAFNMAAGRNSASLCREPLRNLQ